MMFLLFFLGFCLFDNQKETALQKELSQHQLAIVCFGLRKQVESITLINVCANFEWLAKDSVLKNIKVVYADLEQNQEFVTNLNWPINPNQIQFFFHGVNFYYDLKQSAEALFFYLFEFFMWNPQKLETQNDFDLALKGYNFILVYVKELTDTFLTNLRIIRQKCQQANIMLFDNKDFLKEKQEINEQEIWIYYKRDKYNEEISLSFNKQSFRYSDFNQILYSQKNTYPQEVTQQILYDILRITDIKIVIYFYQTKKCEDFQSFLNFYKNQKFQQTYFYLCKFNNFACLEFITLYRLYGKTNYILLIDRTHNQTQKYYLLENQQLNKLQQLLANYKNRKEIKPLTVNSMVNIKFMRQIFILTPSNFQVFKEFFLKFGVVYFVSSFSEDYKKALIQSERLLKLSMDTIKTIKVGVYDYSLNEDPFFPVEYWSSWVFLYDKQKNQFLFISVLQKAEKTYFHLTQLIAKISPQMNQIDVALNPLEMDFGEFLSMQIKEGLQNQVKINKK